MSSDKIAVELKKREVIGKGLNKLRKDGAVPGVVHNHGKDSIHVMGDYLKLTKAYSQAGKHHPVELKIDDKHQLALIKDVDFEPRKHQLRHVVFQAIKQNEKVSAEIPVVLEGEEIPAERQGLLVLPQLDVVQVEALPKNLPDQLFADATKLAEVGDRLHVSDIKAPEGVTILSDLEASLAVVEMPKDQAAEADAAAKALAEDQGASAEDEAAPESEDTQAEAEEESEEKSTES
jgi:large subunit ribosomal protein L25